MDASLLSKILRGQRNPSPKMIKSIGPGLGLKAQQISMILSGKEDVTYNKVSEDIFAVINDWFHFAILELIKTESFQSDSTFIASRLSIHKVEAQAALERLERLDFIEIIDGVIKLKARNNTWANNEMTSVARRNLQKQLAIKASEAIDHISFESRESGSLTIACAKDMIPEVRKKIQNFRRELDEFIEAHDKPDEVYQLVVSFFPLTNIDK